MKQELTLTRDWIDAYHHGQAPAEGRWAPRPTETEIEESPAAAVAGAGDGGWGPFAYGSR